MNEVLYLGEKSFVSGKWKHTFVCMYSGHYGHTSPHAFLQSSGLFLGQQNSH